VRFQENYIVFSSTTSPTTENKTASGIFSTVQYPARARAGTVQYSSTVQSRDYVILYSISTVLISYAVSVVLLYTDACRKIATMDLTMYV
jgi:hypothetical protein